MNSIIATSHLLLTNIVFLSSFFSAMFAFFKAVAADPGFVKKDLSQEKQSRAVEELANENLLDVRHFCLTCLVKQDTVKWITQAKTRSFFRLKNLYAQSTARFATDASLNLTSKRILELLAC
jgi:nitrate reductase cytochrome c-type subunit